MIGIGLLILKIIGFILLGIFGLILTVMFLVLLVPIRYQVEGTYGEKLKGRACISWLLHILSCTLIYENELDIMVRVFGFPLGRQKEKKPPKEKKSKKKLEKEWMPETIPVKPEIPSSPPEEKTIEKKEKYKKHTKKKNKSKEKKNPFSFQRICDKLEQVKMKKDEVIGFLTKDENKKTFRLLWKQVKCLWKHLLPRKVKGWLKFGFGDPYTTGQVLMYLSPFYRLKGQQFRLIPIFEESALEGDLWFRGRIRIGTILILGMRVFLDKNFRLLLKKWQE